MHMFIPATLFNPCRASSSEPTKLHIKASTTQTCTPASLHTYQERVLCVRYNIPSCQHANPRDCLAPCPAPAARRVDMVRARGEQARPRGQRGDTCPASTAAGQEPSWSVAARRERPEAAVSEACLIYGCPRSGRGQGSLDRCAQETGCQRAAAASGNQTRDTNPTLNLACPLLLFERAHARTFANTAGESRVVCLRQLRARSHLIARALLRNRARCRRRAVTPWLPHDPA